MLYLSIHYIVFLSISFVLGVLPIASDNEAIQRLRACKRFPRSINRIVNLKVPPRIASRHVVRQKQIRTYVVDY